MLLKVLQTRIVKMIGNASFYFIKLQVAVATVVCRIIADAPLVINRIVKTELSRTLCRFTVIMSTICALIF